MMGIVTSRISESASRRIGESARTLIGKFSDQQGDHLISQCQAMIEYFGRKKLAGSPIPALAFPGRPDGHRQKPIPLLAITAPVPLLNVGAD
jgi:hypothetical protein